MNIKIAAKWKILSANLRQPTSHFASKDKEYARTITF